MKILRDWFDEYFSDPQVIILALLLITGFAVVITMGYMLAPVLAAVVFAYLLEGIVAWLQRLGVPRLPAVIIVFLLFLAFFVFVMVGLLPLLSRQTSQLVSQIPAMVGKAQEMLMHLPQRYPEFFSEQQVNDMIAAVRQQIGDLGTRVVSISIASVVGVITIVIYLIVVPLLVFFFMKDKDRILAWLNRMLPRESELARVVWRDVDRQIGNYVRGKFWEVVIVWWATYIAFNILGLNFSMLLAVLVGISVIVPYVGAAVVTFPVAVVAYFQWGFTSDFWILISAYLVIQALDGNALVPLLFSEVVNLHPIAIIVAILVFGGLWGFWGAFFAIPLATLVQAVLKAWPRSSTLEQAAG